MGSLSTLITVIEATVRLADAHLQRKGLRFDEARGAYYYETENCKRWVPQGAACEVCEDNADRGWIADDDVFETEQFGDVDGPPGHYHCLCDVEYAERRHRVYV